MKKKNLVVTATATALALTMAFGGTMAYLQESIEEAVDNKIYLNVNDGLKLTETKNNYEIVPGTWQTKDPTLTVNYSEDSYVFVEVTDSTKFVDSEGNITSMVDWYIAEGWNLLGYYYVAEDEVDEDADPAQDDDAATTDLTQRTCVYVYYQLLTNSDEFTVAEGAQSETLSILKDDKIYYSKDLENSDMRAALQALTVEEGEDAYVSLTFDAWIIQANLSGDTNGKNNSVYVALYYANPSVYYKLFGEPTSEDDIWLDVAGNAYYDSVAGAIADAADGDVIVLMAEEYTYTSDTYITVSSDITIDLNGGTLEIAKTSGNTALYFSGSESTITNGTLEANAYIRVYSESEVTLENVNVTLTGSYDGIYVYGGTVTIDEDSTVTSAGNTILTLTNEGVASTINVYGTVTSTGSEVFNSNRLYSAGTETINIYEGASIKTEANTCAIYHPETGTINMYGGTVEGYAGIILGGGTLNVYGGTIIGNAEDDCVLINKAGNAGSMDGSAVIVAPYTNWSTDTAGSGDTLHVHVNIMGGTLQSASSFSIRAYVIDTYDYNDGYGYNWGDTSAGNTITISSAATLSSAATHDSAYYTNLYAIWDTPDYILIPATMDGLLTLTINGTVYTGTTAETE